MHTPILDPRPNRRVSTLVKPPIILQVTGEMPGTTMSIVMPAFDNRTDRVRQVRGFAAGKLAHTA